MREVPVFDSPMIQTFIPSLPRPDRLWDEMESGDEVMAKE